MANTTVPSLQDIFPTVEAAATVAVFGTVERKAIETLLAVGELRQA